MSQGKASMDLTTLLPYVVVAVVAFVALRVVVGVIKTSAKLMVWVAIAAIAVGGGWFWLQSQSDVERPRIPTLSIPGQE